MPDVVVLRAGTEGLPMVEYAAELRERLPASEVRHARTPAEERTFVESASVVTGTNLPDELIERAGNLRLFACTSAGMDHVPLSDLASRGVAVTNAAGIHVPGIAEQVLGYLLVFARRLHEGWRRQRRREWRHYQSGELAGSTVTVVGMGAIGEAVLERLEPFDVETVGVRYTPEKGGPADEVVGLDPADVHATLARTDYLVVACPLTDATEGLIDAAALETLPPDAVIANIARGGIVDTDALVAALRGNEIGGAALDVTDPEPLPEDHPLWNFENVLVTPHVGGHNPRHWTRMADIVSRNVETLFDGGDVEGLENLVAAPR